MNLRYFANEMQKMASGKPSVQVSAKDLYEQQEAHREFQKVLESRTPQAAAKAVAAGALAAGALPVALTMIPWAADLPARKKEVDRLLRQATLAKYYQVSSPDVPAEKTRELAAYVDEFVTSAPDSWRNPEIANQVNRLVRGRAPQPGFPTLAEWDRVERVAKKAVESRGQMIPSRNEIYTRQALRQAKGAVKSSIPFALIGAGLGVKDIMERRKKLREIYGKRNA